MNRLSALFADLQNGQTLTLEKDGVYHVYPEDSFVLTGYFCTNTAKRNENPDGSRVAAMFLQNKHDIAIDGNGASVIVHGKMTPFVFDHCENISVKNLTVDYACPTMTEFTVLSSKDGVCELRFADDSRFRVDGSDLYFRGEDNAQGHPYWENRSNAEKRYVKVFDPIALQCRDFSRADLSFTAIEQTDERTLRVTLQNKDADFVPGHVFQTRNIIRDQTGSLFNRCKNLVFDSLRVKFMHGLGMVSQFCENVSYLHCDFTPGEGRTIASTADFFQFSGCKGLLLVDSCRANGAQDDYINVHGTHLRIVEADAQSRRLTVRFMHDETWGIQAFEAGDSLEFIRWDTLIPYAETRVLSYEKLNDTDIALQLDRTLPDGICVGKDVVENVTWTPDLHVCNCDFGVTAGRGILCTTRGRVIIENNCFFHLWGPAMLVEDDCNFWFESGCTKHIIFRNNVVDGCGYGCTASDAPVIRYSPKVMDETANVFVHGRLTLTGNRFLNPCFGRHAIRLAYLAQAEISDNYFDAPHFISADHCGRIEEN